MVDQTHFQQVPETTEFKKLSQKTSTLLAKLVKVRNQQYVQHIAVPYFKASRQDHRVCKRTAANASEQKRCKDTATQQPPTTKQMSPIRISKHARRLGYKRGAPNCGTCPPSAPRAHQYQPACPPSTAWKTNSTAKVTAPSSSQKEKLTNKNTSVAEDQAQKAQGTAIETPSMQKPFVHPMEEAQGIVVCQRQRRVLSQQQH